MKRNTKEISTHRIYPIFSWVNCANCNQEFRLEKGFGVRVMVEGGLPQNIGIFREYCGVCAPDKATAEKLFREVLSKRDENLAPPSRSERPAPPPPPPPRVSKTSM